jgi:hypothetical protein
MRDLLSNIVNKKQSNIFYTGVVSNTAPIEVKLYSEDDAIKAKSLKSAVDLKVGSNVLMIKFLSKFLIIGVIGAPSVNQEVRVIKLSEVVVLTNATMTNTDLKFTFDANSEYIFHLSLGASGDSAAGIQLDWEVTSGTIPANQVRKCMGMAFGETDRDIAYFRANQSYLTSDISYGIEANVNFLIEEGYLKTTTAGELTLRASKEVATGGNTQISTGSYLTVTKIK